MDDPGSTSSKRTSADFFASAWRPAIAAATD